MDSHTADMDLENYVKEAEANLKREMAELQKKRKPQLVVFSSSSEGSKKSFSLGSITFGSMCSPMSDSIGNLDAVNFMSSNSNQETTPGKIEDIDMPIFNNTLEELINITCELSFISSAPSEKMPPEGFCKISSYNAMQNADEISSLTLQKESRKIIDEIEDLSAKCPLTSEDLSILDMEQLKDSLLESPKLKQEVNSIGEKTFYEAKTSTQSTDSSDNLSISNKTNEDFLLLESGKVLKHIYFNLNASDVDSSNILDLDDINDNLIDSPHPKFVSIVKTKERCDGVPQMSTPKASEKSRYFAKPGSCSNTNLIVKPLPEKHFLVPKNLNCEISLKFDECFAENLKLNCTFEKPTKNDGSNNPSNLDVMHECSDALAKTDKANIKTNSKQVSAVNTTFEKVVNTTFEAENELSPNGKFEKYLNFTFNKNSKKETLNATFEIVGNGSFIIEGKCTNLMDMECNTLQAVLSSTPAKNAKQHLQYATPTTSRMTSMDPKKSKKSLLLQRLPLMNCLSRDGSFVSAKEGKSVEVNSLEEPKGMKEHFGEFSRRELQQPIGPMTREEVRNRLRKNTQLGSTTGIAPLKAVPLKTFPLETMNMKENPGISIFKRASSTPVTGDKKYVSKLTKYSDFKGKENKTPSLPSFGSVSSIETECLDNFDAVNDGSLGTPEVFRTRGIGGPRITSTPAMPYNGIPRAVLGELKTTPIAFPPESAGKHFKSNYLVCNWK